MDVGTVIADVVSGAQTVSTALAEIAPAEQAVESAVTTSKAEAVHVGSFLESILGGVDLSVFEQETFTAIEAFVAKLKAAF